MAVIDLQLIASSLYDTVTNLNATATLMVGLDAIYCRLLPYDNGEDVIVQEYTLHLYECPKNIKVVTGNSSYLVGNFAIDLFGIKSSEALSVSIDKATWEAVYGTSAMPQKGDFILIPTLHKPYEVATTAPVHTIGELLTSWNLQLTEWRHKASRKESEDFTVSIDELTVSQDRLFGDAISKEVADAVVEVETAYNTTTYVDPIKDFDIDSIVLAEDLIGESGNIFSNAYYDFLKASKNVTYKHIDGIYEPSVKENHWIYTCWFKASDNDIETASVKIDKKLYLKDKDFWWLAIKPGMKVHDGDEITIYRGGMIKLSGVVESKECESGCTLKVHASDCLTANKKVANFWTAGVWKMQKYSAFNLFNAYNGESKTMSINIDANSIKVLIGNATKDIELKSISGAKIQYNKWTYAAFDMCPTSIRILLSLITVNADSNVKSNLIYDTETPINIKTFSFDSASIENMGENVKMTNIRLYENEYPLANNYKLDMYSEVTRNASKLILVDCPNPANKMSFKTKVR